MKIKQKGFTLVEVLIVICILGIIAVIAVTSISNNKENAMAALLVHSNDASVPENVGRSNLVVNLDISSNWKEVKLVAKMVDFGNGVYYFNHTEASFGNALSTFTAINPNLEITAMVPNVVRQNRAGFQEGKQVYDYGAAVGYFVTFREKEAR